MSSHHRHHRRHHRVPTSTGWQSRNKPYPPPSNAKIAFWVLLVFAVAMQSGGYLAGMQ